MSDEVVDTSIVTPVRSPGFLALLLGGPAVLGLAARLAARFGPKRPFRLGKRVVAARYGHVRELLERDLDFGIAAVNAGKIREVNGGPFILGMDRSAVLERERRALYAALAAVDMKRLRHELETDIAERLDSAEAGEKLDAIGSYARPLAARTAHRLFGITGPNPQTFMEVTRSIFGQTFLNLSDDAEVRARGIRAGELMQAWLAAEIGRRRETGEDGDDLMGHLMRQAVLDDDGVRRSLGGMMVGSVDTTATCVAKILTVMARQPQLQYSIRQDLGDLDRLYGWCMDALRFWPHNPIVLRKATSDTELGGLAIKSGESVIAWTQAAMRDPTTFPEPKRLRGDRDPLTYLHFGGGLHPCSGRPVNHFQIPLLVAGLVARGIGHIGGIKWAGPFPNRLDVTLRKGRA